MSDTLDSLRAERDEARENLRRAVEWIEEWRVLREAEIARYRAALATSARLRRSHPERVTPRLRAAVAALDALLAVPVYRRDQVAASAAIGEHHRALAEIREG